MSSTTNDPREHQKQVPDSDAATISTTDSGFETDATEPAITPETEEETKGGDDVEPDLLFTYVPI
jgi:hypothetical protein